MCLLHFNEIVYKKVFFFYDGVAEGPGCYRGPIGCIITSKDRVLGPIVRYKKVQGKVPVVSKEFYDNLSQDQAYFYEICHAVQGNWNQFPAHLITKSPGVIHQARWVTNASNVLRLYVETENPGRELVRLVHIILNLYGPSFFKIKMNYQVYKGAENYHFILKCANQTLFQNEKAVVKDAFETNSYMAHAEFVLLNALFDPNDTRRETAVQYIIRDRKRRLRDGRIRQFIKPETINFRAQDYWNLVDWNSINPYDITEPPLTFDLDEQALRSCITEKDNLTLARIPCHSQNVERLVKTTSEAVGAAIGHENTHGMILSTISSRERFSKDASKSDFYNMD